MGCGASRTNHGMPWTQDGFDKVTFTSGKPCKYYDVDWSRPLGSGSFGTVWEYARAQVQHAGGASVAGGSNGTNSSKQSEHVAVKVVDVSELRMLKNFEKEMKKVEEEAAILKRLSHVGVVQLLDVIRDGDNYCMVLEYS